MLEVKADGLEASFEALEKEDDGVEALKAELALLKKKIDEGVITAQRPALDGVKSVEASNFVEQYLRKGIEAGLEKLDLLAEPGQSLVAASVSVVARVEQRRGSLLHPLRRYRRL